jgi:membrane-associated phospholipid phosphatase
MARSSDHRLTRNELSVLLVVIATVAIAGTVLYAAGYNEGFYSGDARVRAVFEALTELGNDKLYLVVLSLIYLSYDKRFGRRLCLVFFSAVYMTDLLKEFFHDPRPPSNAERESPVSGYGLPSGHTTTSVTFYGYILLDHLDRASGRWPLVLLCGFPVVVVPLSRMVIGAHDLQDVVGGAVMALSLLVAYMVVLPRVAPLVVRWPVHKQVGVGVLMVLLLWSLGCLMLVLRHPGELGTATEETAMGVGLLMGCAIAFPLEEAYVDYRPDVLDMRGRIVAALVGLPVTVGSYVAIAGVGDALLPEVASELLTHSALILVLALLVPYLLVWLTKRPGVMGTVSDRGAP